MSHRDFMAGYMAGREEGQKRVSRKVASSGVGLFDQYGDLFCELKESTAWPGYYTPALDELAMDIGETYTVRRM